MHLPPHTHTHHTPLHGHCCPLHLPTLHYTLPPTCRALTTTTTHCTLPFTHTPCTHFTHYTRGSGSSERFTTLPRCTSFWVSPLHTTLHSRNYKPTPQKPFTHFRKTTHRGRTFGKTHTRTPCPAAFFFFLPLYRLLPPRALDVLPALPLPYGTLIGETVLTRA